MGKTYLFECQNCGYRAKIAGGFSEGTDLKVQTILCRDCRSLYDCVVSLRTQVPPRRWKELERRTKETAPTLTSALARLPVPPGAGREWWQFDPACPMNPSHRVKVWTSPGRCPRCKTYMERGALPYRVWD